MPFPDEYFTCSSHCLSCKWVIVSYFYHFLLNNCLSCKCSARCTNSMNHWSDRQPHLAPHKCKYQHQFNNQIFICRACNDRGESSTVIPKAGANGDSTWVGIARYAWSGYILECKFCGVIYRSRQYWYGNKEPTEESVVRTEIQHVWPDVCLPFLSFLFHSFDLNIQFSIHMFFIWILFEFYIYFPFETY